VSDRYIIRTTGQTGPVDTTAQTQLAAHLADTSDAHDASAISVLDTAGNYTATDVEAVLAELPSRFVSLPLSDRVDGEVPVWDETAGEWVSGPGGGGVPMTLAELDDVSATTPTTGDVLTFNGSDWVPDPIEIDLSSATAVTPTSSDYVVGTDTSNANVNAKFLVSEIVALSALSAVPSLVQSDAVKYVSIPGVTSVDAATATSFTANILWYWPIYLLAPITVTELHLGVTVAASAGQVALAGIVSADSEYQPSGTYSAFGSALAIDSTGRKSNTGLSVTVPAGRHLLWYNADGSASLSCITTSPLGQSRPAALNAGSGVDTQILSLTASFSYTGSVPGLTKWTSHSNSRRCPVFLCWT